MLFFGGKIVSRIFWQIYFHISEIIYFEKRTRDGSGYRKYWVTSSILKYLQQDPVFQSLKIFKSQK